MHPITKQIHQAITRTTQGLSESQMHLHPQGKWDSAAILEHLALTFGSTARVMEKCLRQERTLATASSTKFRIRQFVVLGLNYIPGGRTAPERVTPKGISGREALELIFSNLETMDHALAQCEQRFGCKEKIADHPVLGPIPITGWRKFHLLHTRHHMKQIEERARGEQQAAATATNQRG